MKIDEVRRRRRAAQIRAIASRITKRIDDIDCELSRLIEYANELDSGLIKYVGVYRKDDPRKP